MFTVSYTEIKRWRFCRQSYFYNYVEEIVPRRKAKPLKIGSAIHQVIESWAKGERYDRVMNSIADEYEKMFEEEREYYGNIPELLENIINGYFARYGFDERDEYFMVEKTFGPIPLTSQTQFKFKIDRMTKTKAGNTLCEMKTGRKIPEEDMRIWDLQTVLYAWGLRQLGHNVDAVLWDYIRTKPPTYPRQLKDGSLSKNKDIDTDYETYHMAIVNLLGKKHVPEYKEILDMLKAKPSRFYKRILQPINEDMMEALVRDAKISAIEMSKLREHPVKNISGFTCPRCFYSSLCFAELRGLDSDFIREKEYMNRKEETTYGSEEIEESEED